MTDEYGYFVCETQDTPGNNRSDLGDNQVPGLEQHKDGHQHIHTAVLLLTGLNPYFYYGLMFQ